MSNLFFKKDANNRVRQFWKEKAGGCWAVTPAWPKAKVKVKHLLLAWFLAQGKLKLKESLFQHTQSNKACGTFLAQSLCFSLIFFTGLLGGRQIHIYYDLQYNPKQSCIIFSPLTLMDIEGCSSSSDCADRNLEWWVGRVLLWSTAFPDFTSEFSAGGTEYTVSLYELVVGTA